MYFLFEQNRIYVFVYYHKSMIDKFEAKTFRLMARSMFGMI